MSFVNVYHFLCVLLYPFGFEGGIWDLIVLLPDHCISIYFSVCVWDPHCIQAILFDTDRNKRKKKKKKKKKKNIPQDSHCNSLPVLLYLAHELVVVSSCVLQLQWSSDNAD